MIENLVLDNGTVYKREGDGILPDTTPSSKLWVIKGDEELPMHNYRSRTADPNWKWYSCTPSVFRYDKVPVEPKNDYRVDISPLDGSIRALNQQDPKKYGYLYNNL
jgi:hypothetical protein